MTPAAPQQMTQCKRRSKRAPGRGSSHLDIGSGPWDTERVSGCGHWLEEETMRFPVKILATAVIAGSVCSLAGTAGAVPLAASMSLRDASTPLVESVQWRRGWGWGGVGLGLAAGAIIGGAIAANSYYGGYYGYGYPAYGYSYGYPAYSYGYYPAYSYGYGYAPAAYGYAYYPRYRYYRRW
jgi:hypothetical protein